MLDTTSVNSYAWIICVVENYLPLTFVESESIRKYSKLKPISRITLKKHMILVQKFVQIKIADVLPIKIGLVFDGWSCNGIHYVGLFAVSIAKSPFLVKFSPFENEEDLGACSYIEFIENTLEVYKKSWDNILFLVSDNCPVNLSIANRTGLPFIGCASHRFNLAMKTYLEPHEIILKKINDIMKKLSTIKGRAWLKRKTECSPVLRNVTRWSSTFMMIERYTQISTFLCHSTNNEIQKLGLLSLMLTSDEELTVLGIYSDLKKFHQVTLKLQEDQITLSDVRSIFDFTILNYPGLKKYLDSASAIVHNVALESGLVKLQRKELQDLTETEKKNLTRFEVLDGSFVVKENVKEDDFVGQALKRARYGEKEKNGYMDVSFVPPTSNICERFFSKSKLDLINGIRKLLQRIDFGLRLIGFYLRSFIIIVKDRNNNNNKDRIIFAS